MKAAAATCLTASACTLAALSLVVSQRAAGAAWEFNPTVEAGYLYDDNYRLSQPGTEIDVQGALLDAQLEMRSLTQQGEISFIPRVRATYFPDESDLDSQDYFANFDWQRHGQRWDTRVRADFAEQDVTNSEQPDAEVDSGLGEPVFGDAGRVLVTNRRTRFAVRPQGNFELSERREIQLEAGYSDVSFDRSVSDAQLGFDTADVAAGLITRISQLSNFTVRVRGAHYDIQQRDVTTAYGGEVQWDTHNQSETRTFLRAGAQNVELADGESEVAWVAGAGVSFLLGRNELFADVSRSVGPSSAGVVVSRDQLRMRFTRTVSPRLSLLAGLRGTNDEAIDRSTTFQPRKYATGDVGLQWRWQEELSLRLAYDYTWQEFSDSVDAATSSGAVISVLYQPLQRRR